MRLTNPSIGISAGFIFALALVVILSLAPTSTFADHEPAVPPIDVDGWARTPAPTIALETGYAGNGIIYTQDAQTGEFAGTLFFSEDGDNYYFAFELSDLVNDNSYGSGSSSIWGNRGHRLSDLVNSEHAKIRIESANGTYVFDFDFDYASGGPDSRGQTVVGPIESLGPIGGDGAVNELNSAVPFDPATDMEWATSLIWNINNVDDADGLGGNLSDSPSLPFTDSTPFTAGNIGFSGHSWIPELVYEWSVPKAVFGNEGLGDIVVNNVTISEVHNSPFRDPNPVPLPIVAVDKTSDPASGSEVFRGDEIAFAVTGANVGLTELGTVVITDDIDDNFAVIEATISDGGSLSGQDANGRGGIITWNAGTLAIGATITRTYIAVADPINSPLTQRLDVFNQAVFDFVANGSPGTIGTPVTNHYILPEPVLGISKAHSLAGPFAPGETVTYSVTFDNTGGAPATGTVVTDDYDETAGAITSISDGGSSDGNVITWNLGTLSPLDPPRVLTYQMVLAPATDGVFPEGTTDVLNTAAVISSETPRETAEDQIAVIADGEVGITKADSLNPDTASPGDSVVYTLTVSATGDATSADVIVTDDYDESSGTITAISDAGTDDGGAIT